MLGAEQFRLDVHYQLRVVAQMPVACFPGLVGRHQLVPGVFANALQQAIADRLVSPAAHDQRLGDQFLQAIQHLVRGLVRFRAHRRRGFGGPAAGEDRQPAQHALFCGRQQVIAPGESGAQGLVPRGLV